MSDIEARANVKRRSKGEKTRALILNAAIEVLAQQGIKGTTHRAVALKANIQLSLTTYYFKDIQELVHEAFQLNSLQLLERVANTWQKAFEIIETYNDKDLTNTSVKEELRDVLADFAANYLFNKIKEQPIALAVEQLLFTTIQITPALRALANKHRSALLAPFIHWCEYFNPETAFVDADIMLTVFTQLEYRNLAIDTSAIDLTAIRAVVSRAIGNVMALRT